MPEDRREAVIATIEVRYNPEKYEEHVIDCPACFRGALVSGYTELEWKADWDEGGASPYPVVEFFPGHLDCQVCDLELDGEDEMTAADVSAWELDDVEPADFYDDDERW